jgi:mRNA interferase MazF
MRRGEVWQVQLPPGVGHVQGGDRPAVLLQNDAITLRLPTVFIVPFTGNLAATRFRGTVVVQPDATNGLTSPSVALVFQMRVLDKRDCRVRLGTLDDQDVQATLAVLNRLTG